MALVLKDRVKETSVSTGTGAIALDGATGAYQTFSTIGNGNTTYYCIAGQTTNEWEVGIGTYNSGTDSISRDVILASSNSNTIVTFSAGTKDVFITYPSEKAIYEEPDGDTLINAGPITVLGPGVSGIPSPYSDTLGRFYGNVDSFQQLYLQNQFNGVDASSDIVAYNNLGDGTNYFVDMGIVGSSYSSMSFPIFTANCAYVYSTGLTTGTGAAGETSDLLIGTGTLNSDLVLFTGGVDTTNEAVRISGADQTIEVQKGVTLNETLDVTGAATFGSTVLLDANPTTALQAATKQYVDNAVSTGIHIHEQLYAEISAALAAVYTQGGTTDTITTITNTDTVTLASATPSLNDELWLYTSAGNGLSTNTGYFVEEIVSPGVVKLSLIPGGAPITGLTNAAGLTYAVRINPGVGAYLESSANATFAISGVTGLTTGQRILVYQQSTGYWNGVYTITSMGSAGSKWKLTRATDQNMYEPSNVYGMGAGDYFFITTVTEAYVLTTTDVIIIGYTSLTYTLFSAATVYTGTAPVVVTGSVISLNTVPATSGGTGVNTVTTGDVLYGSATNTWSKLAVGSAHQSLVVNGSGTNVEWNAVNLSSSNAVTGVLAATLGGTGQTTYATGDMLYSSATNTISKLSGTTSTTKHFLSQTGTGSASAAPSWDEISATDITSGTLPAVRGGTGQSAYAVGDLLYADTTTTLAKLADVATGNALISGGLSTAPAWGKIGLTTHVSGTLGIANGGTNSTATPTAGGVNYGTGTAHAFTAAGTAGQILTSAGASAPTWQDNAPAFPSGTRMSFQQTTAPTGWTKDTTAAIDNSALRFVTGAASSGGSVAFTTAFASQAVTGSVAATANATATNQATTAGGSVAATANATATNQATTETGSISVSVSAGTLAVGAGTFAVGATTLATTQIPAHTHPYSTMQNQALAGRVSLNDRYPIQPATTGATGGGGSHNHSLTGSPSLSGSPSVTGASFTANAHNHTQDAHSHTSGAFTGTSHNHTQDAHSHTSGAFTGTSINLAVKYYDFIIASKD